MKLRFFLSFFIAIAICSCSSDDGFETIDDRNIPNLLDGSMDIANGRNIIFLDAEDLESFQLKLGTKRNVSATVASDFPLKVKIVTGADTTRYLSFSQSGSVLNLDAPAVYDICLQLVADPTVKKDLKLVVRPHGSLPTDVSEYAYNIGKGTKVWSELGNVTYPIIDFGQIEKHLSDNVNNVQTGVQFEIGGERYQETMDRVCSKSDSGDWDAVAAML